MEALRQSQTNVVPAHMPTVQIPRVFFSFCLNTHNVCLGYRVTHLQNSSCHYDRVTPSISKPVVPKLRNCISCNHMEHAVPMPGNPSADHVDHVFRNGLEIISKNKQ